MYTLRVSSIFVRWYNESDADARNFGPEEVLGFKRYIAPLSLSLCGTILYTRREIEKRMHRVNINLKIHLEA